MDAIIVSIGDELVLGQTVDTNSAWLSRQLAAVGCAVRGHVTVADDQKAIEDIIRESAPRCDYLIITGGLGPTADDLTRQALAGVLGVPLEMNQEWLTQLESFFKARGRPMPEQNRIQAMIPRGAEMIFNTCGTAAGIRAIADCGLRIAELGKVNPLRASVPPCSLSFNPQSEIRNPQSPCTIFIMPGVPKEMVAMFNRDLLPELRQRAGGAEILSRTLHTFGLGESWVAEKLGDLMRRDRNPSVGTTVSRGIVSLRVNARFGSAAAAQVELEQTTRLCREALGDLIFGQDDETLPGVVAGMLRQAGKTVTTAESCTGGLVAKLLTDIPGSSNYYRFGFVTYANEAKTQLLGVPPATLAAHGAVSEETVRAMATGARERAAADVGLAVSGVAGPDGGSNEKPVGTVWIALAHAGGAEARRFNFPGDREMIRDRAAKMALWMLRYQLMCKSMPL